MLFNSFEFFIFFPLVVGLYFVMPHAWRWLLLLLASIVFYMFFIPEYVLILFATISIDFVSAKMIEKSEGEKRKLWLAISVSATCLILFFFKYFDLFSVAVHDLAHLIGWNYPTKLLGIILPIGLSFHTFQSLSYVIEVYRGNQKAERSFGIFSLYVMFFPQLVAGPIERPQHLLPQFREVHSFNYSDVSIGMQRIIWGLFKKVVVADNLAQIVNSVYSQPETMGWKWLVIGTLFFSVQIYCDFSGYSDIAVGTARVMGFRLMENFRFPYRASGFREFWGRWHISLSNWFRDYVYKPLGGSRHSSLKTVFNLMVVFAISGLWHGAQWTFVIWGLIHGALVVVERYLPNMKATNSRIGIFAKSSAVFIAVSFAWIFFRSNSLDQALAIVQRILGFAQQSEFLPSYLGSLSKYTLIFFAIIGMVFLIFDRVITEIAKGERTFSYSKKLVLYSALVAMILVFGFWGKVQFIYFQF